MLAAVLAWNAAANPDRQALVAELLGAKGTSASAAIKNLVKTLGLPTTLAEVGIKPENYRDIGERTMHDRGIATNPRAINGPDDIIEILKLAA